MKPRRALSLCCAFAALLVGCGLPLAAAGPTPTEDLAAYTIGADDVLEIVFWRDKELTAIVTVRPDGRISLPLLNDVEAAGLTPLQLRDRLLEEARRYIEDPSIAVVVKEIKSRRVFITGNVEKPGTYPLTSPTTVLQLIAAAGGLKEFVSGKNIAIVRWDGGRQAYLTFNYQKAVSGRDLDQNLPLQPGDTVVVP